MLRRLADEDAESTAIFQTSDMDRYWARPTFLSDICLAQFVAEYKVVYNRSATFSEGGENEDDASSPLIRLQDGKGSMKKRQRPCIIRYMRVSKERDTEKYYCNLLRLFLPHRGKVLKPENHTYESFFTTCGIETLEGSQLIEDIVANNQGLYEHNADAIDDAWQMVQEQGVADDAWADVAPNAEEQRQDAKYKHLQIVIIDDVSMVGKKMLNTISERLIQIKRVKAAFGNVSVLAVGDFYQIPPVGDSALYKDDKAELCESPWSTFSVWNLTEIMRQKDDQLYATALNR